MARLNHRQIEAFRAAVQLGSATAAAESLFISQPAVTRLLADLERQIGFDLFERRRHGLQPTTDGLTLFDEVERSFRGLERIQEVADAISSHKIGRIRVIALPVYADAFVAKGVAAFLKKNPDVFIELENVGNEGLVDSLVSEKYDIGISTAPRAMQGIQTTKLAEHAAVCIVPPDHPFADLKRVSIAALVDQPFVALPTGSPFRHAVEQHVGATGKPLRYVAEVRTQRAICQLVAAGGGISIVDPSSIELPNETLRTITLDPPLKWSIVAVTPLRKTQSVAAQALMQEIKAQIAVTNSSQR